MIPALETDLDPATGWPRIRFNFANGWSASVIVRAGRNRMDARYAALAACPTGRWNTGAIQLGEQEASSDEVALYLDGIRSRPSLIDRGPLIARLDIDPIEPHTVCRGCGCTPADPCLHDRQPCHWVEDDLCSRCDAQGRGRAAA